MISDSFFLLSSSLIRAFKTCLFFFHCQEFQRFDRFGLFRKQRHSKSVSLNACFSFTAFCKTFQINLTFISQNVEVELWNLLLFAAFLLSSERGVTASDLLAVGTSVSVTGTSVRAESVPALGLSSSNAFFICDEIPSVAMQNFGSRLTSSQGSSWVKTLPVSVW